MAPSPVRAASGGRVERVADGAALLLPAALIPALGFNAGGRFSGAQAVAALVLLVTFALRIAVRRNALAGFGWILRVVGGAVLGLAGWALLSKGWSASPYKAPLAATLTLLYALAVLTTGAVGFTVARMRVLLLAVLAGVAIVVLAGLLSRTLPDVFPTRAPLDAARLGFPLDYWNALGFLAGTGLILAFHFGSDLASSRAVRAAVTALAPPLATTLLLTLSRGALGAVAIALVIYVAVGHSRGLPAAVLSVVPPTTIALVVTYRAVLLTSASYATRDGVHEGHVLIAAVILCAAAAAGLRWWTDRLDRRLLAVRLDRTAIRRIRIRAAIAVGALAAVAIAVSTGTIADQYHRFVNNSPPGGGAIRQRLLTAYNDGHLPLWRAALRQFHEQPVTGTGARTFETVWDRIGTIPIPAPYAHSLYLGVLGDLGLVGAALLLAFLGGLILGVARRARGDSRTVAAVGLAVLVAWLVHAGIDWLWGVPAVSIAPLAIAGLATGRGSRRRVPHGTAGLRLTALLACAALAIVPVRVAVSQLRLHQAAQAYAAGDCATTAARARSSLAALDRPEPLGLMATCDSHHGRQAQALAVIDQALAQDHGSWTWHYERGLILARDGRNGLDELRRASAMYPRNFLIVETAAAIEQAGNRSRREQVSRRLPDLSFAGL